MQSYDKEPKALIDLIKPALSYQRSAQLKFYDSKETYEFFGLACEQYIHEPSIGFIYGVGYVHPVEKDADGMIYYLSINERERLVQEYYSLYLEYRKGERWAFYEMKKHFQNNFLFSLSFMDAVVDFINPLGCVKPEPDLSAWVKGFKVYWEKYMDKIMTHFKQDVDNAVIQLSMINTNIDDPREHIKSGLSNKIWQMAYPAMACYGETLKDNILYFIYSMPVNANLMIKSDE